MPWPPDLRTARALTGNPLVTCGCGRETNADMMRDLRPVRALLGTTADYECDSCLAGHLRHGRITHEAFARAHGAPAALIASAAARDAALARAGL